MDNAVVAWFSALFPLAPADSGNGAPITHDSGLSALSMLLIVLCCIAAIELGARARQHDGGVRMIWLAAAGALFGLGAWAMHYVGFLAMQTPLLRGFVFGPNAASLLIALVFGASGFCFVGPAPSNTRVALTGIWTGLAGVLMHYVGMHGLLVDGSLAYRSPFILGTTIGAIAACIAAFWLATRDLPGRTRALLSLPMGMGIASLHFFDMSGTVLTPKPSFSAPPDLAIGAQAVVVALSVIACAAIALAATRLDAGPSSSRRRADAQPTDPNNEEGVIFVPDVPRARISSARGGNAATDISA